MDVYPSGITASATFTPAAAAYSVGDVIATPQELLFVDKDGRPVPPGSLIRILDVILKIDETALLSGEGSYDAQFYSITPPSAIADNGAWTLLGTTDLDAYRGKITIGTPVDLGSACYIKAQPSDQQDMKLATGKSSLWMYLVSSGGAAFLAVARQIIVYAVLL
jgi:hypothetical protein